MRKIRLKAEFDIRRARFSNSDAEAKLDELSERARGTQEKQGSGRWTERESWDLKADANLGSGVATISDVIFLIPGASACGSGTRNLETKAINLRGKLATQASLPKAAGGVKSILLAPLDPFFRRKGGGAVTPFTVTGTYSHPVFRTSFLSPRGFAAIIKTGEGSSRKTSLIAALPHCAAIPPPI